MRFRALVAPLIITASIARPAAAAEIEFDMRVVIRTYQNGMIRGVDLEAGMKTAISILVAAGLDVEWRACGGGAAATGPESRRMACAAPLGANELAVRFVRMPTEAGYRGDLPLGYSLVDTRTRSGALATIFLDRVGWLASAAQVDATPLLGRAIAHEAGHLLLGTNAHADAGLMRAVWSCEALQRNDPREWTFAPDDSDAMRQAVRLRSLPQVVMR